jgi:hypothetical protein
MPKGMTRYCQIGKTLLILREKQLYNTLIKQFNQT